MISRGQLRALGYTRDAIRHRVARGRLVLVLPDVYSATPAALPEEGMLMATTLSCGPGAAVSHFSAAFLWGMTDRLRRPIEVTLPIERRLKRPALRLHRTRRTARPEGTPPTTRCPPATRRPTPSSSDFGTRDGIPVTSPLRTLLDLAPIVRERRLERLVNEADKLGLIGAESLREALDARAGEPGVRALRALLDRDTFRLTDSELERRFLALVRRAGLPPPETGSEVNGLVVDFHWPGHGVVVETDGLRYHRTPASQARDLERDQAHLLAGLTPLRFTHAQVTKDPESVIATLSAVLARATPRLP